MNDADPTPDEIPVSPVVLTGHPIVDDALEALDRLPDLDVTAHAAEFDAIHGVLRDVLSGAVGEDHPDSA